MGGYFKALIEGMLSATVRESCKIANVWKELDEIAGIRVFPNAEMLLSLLLSSPRTHAPNYRISGRCSSKTLLGSCHEGTCKGVILSCTMARCWDTFGLVDT